MTESNLVCVLDFEKYAKSRLDRNALDYYQSGAGHEFTLRDNRLAFNRLQLRPRMLRDVSRRDLTTTVLGQQMSFPIGLSPTAMQRMAHPDGEVGAAKAAASMGTVMILSTLSTSSIEEIGEAAPNGLNWFQLYIYKDRSVSEQLVRRAEQAGFRAIVLTVDAPIFGRRLPDIRNRFVLPPHLKLANFATDDVKSEGVNSRDQSGSSLDTYVKSLFDQSVTWKDISWLKSITSLPIVLKGILTAEDAELAVQHNVSAIMVSNHGARQLDGVAATIDVLSEVIMATKGRCEVYLDGGVTTGTDALRALALGAKAVFIGRPVLWALVYKGEEGVRSMLEILKKEFDLAMALSGCAKIADINPGIVCRASHL